MSESEKTEKGKKTKKTSNKGLDLSKIELTPRISLPAPRKPGIRGTTERPGTLPFGRTGSPEAIPSSFEPETGALTRLYFYSVSSPGVQLWLRLTLGEQKPRRQ
ncbi:hypothetical protein ISCGN_003552 [Ixodes scapularis]